MLDKKRNLSSKVVEFTTPEDKSEKQGFHGPAGTLPASSMWTKELGRRVTLMATNRHYSMSFKP